jgi:hypothetical protein
MIRYVRYRQNSLAAMEREKAGLTGEPRFPLGERCLLVHLSRSIGEANFEDRDKT